MERDSSLWDGRRVGPKAHGAARAARRQSTAPYPRPSAEAECRCAVHPTGARARTRGPAQPSGLIWALVAGILALGGATTPSQCPAGKMLQDRVRAAANARRCRLCVSLADADLCSVSNWCGGAPENACSDTLACICL